MNFCLSTDEVSESKKQKLHHDVESSLTGSSSPLSNILTSLAGLKANSSKFGKLEITMFQKTMLNSILLISQKGNALEQQD